MDIALKQVTRTAQRRPLQGLGPDALMECLDLAPVGLIDFSADGNIRMINAAAASLLMKLTPAAELRNIYDLLAAAAPGLRDRIEGFEPSEGVVCAHLQLRVPGAQRVLTLGVNKVRPGGFMGVLQDITVAVQEETRIRDDGTRLQALLATVCGYAMCSADLDGAIHGANWSLTRLGGWKPADIEGRPVKIFFPAGSDGEAEAAHLLETCRRLGTATFEGWLRREDDGLFWGSVAATALPDGNGCAKGHVLVFRDLTESRQIEALTALASRDPLTGAYNRRAGETMLSGAFDHWQKGAGSFAVLMIDIDHFKRANDNWGHEFGDQVLIDLVRLCQDLLREGDALVRWGGEEFQILLPGTTLAAACEVGERLRLAVEQCGARAGGGAITVSVGAADIRRGDRDANDVVRRADRALYAAKQAGRNCLVGYEDGVGSARLH